MSCQCGCGRLLHMVNDGRGLPRRWVVGDLRARPHYRLHYTIENGFPGRWIEIGGCRTPSFMTALDACMNVRMMLSRYMWMHINLDPPQMMEWTDNMPNNPRSWS